LTTWLSMVHDLDNAKFREDAATLSDAIEREGYAAHRSADFLEGLSTFKAYWRDVKPAHHARSEIMSRLRRHAEDKRHLRVAEGRLEQLVEVRTRDQLRQQAALLLDAADVIRDWLQWHKERDRPVDGTWMRSPAGAADLDEARTSLDAQETNS